VEYDNIVTLVINSLKSKQVDYCFNKKDMNNIVAEAKKLELSLYYKEYFDKYGDLDYYEVVPAQYSILNNDKDVWLKGQCHKITEIPLEMQCVILRNTYPYILKYYDEPISKANLKISY
jgi:hypothetical protein